MFSTSFISDSSQSLSGVNEGLLSMKVSTLVLALSASLFAVFFASDADLRDAELHQHYMEFLEQLDDVSRDLVKLRRSGVKIEDAAKHVGLTKSGAAKRMRSIKRKWATWMVQYDD